MIGQKVKFSPKKNSYFTPFDRKFYFGPITFHLLSHADNAPYLYAKIMPGHNAQDYFYKRLNLYYKIQNWISF